tara:strand:+ start:253 stop:369 length:117 start_codon:yes stop_codon:yes gene_type:complete
MLVEKFNALPKFDVVIIYIFLYLIKIKENPPSHNSKAG